jgi:hypothetical protein
VTYLVRYSGLSGPVAAAHIHTGAVGVSGGVILPLVAGPSPMTGTLTAANFAASGPVTTFAEAVAAIRAGTTYFNVHTAAHPGGEIRGQIGVTVAAPAPSATPTTAPTAVPTAPPTSTVQPALPASGTDAGLIVLIGLLAGALTIAEFGRRHRSAAR